MRAYHQQTGIAITSLLGVIDTQAAEHLASANNRARKHEAPREQHIMPSEYSIMCLRCF